MKQIRCPSGHGIMQRMYSRKSIGKKSIWSKTKYYFCDVCQNAYSTEILDMKTRKEQMADRRKLWHERRQKTGKKD